MFRFIILVVGLGLFLGCGSDYDIVPVSGTVILDGKTPIAGEKIVFMPRAKEDTLDAGPFSTAVTDKDGKFSLVCRTGQNGAVVGVHRVTFESAGGELLDEVLGEYAEAKASGDQEAMNAARERVEKIRKNKKRSHLPPQYIDSRLIEFSVPKGGANDIVIELKSDQ